MVFDTPGCDPVEVTLDMEDNDGFGRMLNQGMYYQHRSISQHVTSLREAQRLVEREIAAGRILRVGRSPDELTLPPLAGGASGRRGSATGQAWTRSAINSRNSQGEVDDLGVDEA